MSNSRSTLPNGLIAYGPDANCTLAICPIDKSVYQYRPDLAGNAVFIALFGICLVIHLIQGIAWRTWVYMTLMVVGCVCEMLGYGGRIMLYNNPFSFTGFLMQISELPDLKKNLFLIILLFWRNRFNMKIFAKI